MVVTDDGKFRRNEDTILTPATMTHTDRTSLFFQSGMIGQVTLGPFRWKNIGRIRMCFLLRFNQLHLFVVSASYEFSAFGLKNRKNRLKCFNHIFLKRKIYHKYAGISVSKIIIALTISHKVRTHFGRFIIIQTENYFRLDGPCIKHIRCLWPDDESDSVDDKSDETGVWGPLGTAANTWFPSSSVWLQWFSSLIL